MINSSLWVMRKRSLLLSSPVLPRWLQVSSSFFLFSFLFFFFSIISLYTNFCYCLSSHLEDASRSSFGLTRTPSGVKKLCPSMIRKNDSLLVLGTTGSPIGELYFLIFSFHFIFQFSIFSFLFYSLHSQLPVPFRHPVLPTLFWIKPNNSVPTRRLHIVLLVLQGVGHPLRQRL